MIGVAGNRSGVAAGQNPSQFRRLTTIFRGRQEGSEIQERIGSPASDYGLKWADKIRPAIEPLLKKTKDRQTPAGGRQTRIWTVDATALLPIAKIMTDPACGCNAGSIADNVLHHPPQILTFPDTVPEHPSSVATVDRVQANVHPVRKTRRLDPGWPQTCAADRSVDHACLLDPNPRIGGGGGKGWRRPFACVLPPFSLCPTTGLRLDKRGTFEKGDS